MGSTVLCMTGAIHTCMLYTIAIVTVGCSASTVTVTTGSKLTSRVLRCCMSVNQSGVVDRRQTK